MDSRKKKILKQAIEDIDDLLREFESLSAGRGSSKAAEYGDALSESLSNLGRPTEALDRWLRYPDEDGTREAPAEGLRANKAELRRELAEVRGGTP